MVSAFGKPEVWVIDAAVERRSVLSMHLGSLGYLAYPMDPTDRLPSNKGRSVIAVINDDDNVVDRLLNCREASPLSCVVYSDCLKTKRVSNLLSRGVAELFDWPLDRQEFADALSNAEVSLSAIVEEKWQGVSALERVEGLSPREREVLAGIMAGKTSREIAGDLGLSTRTIEVHRLHCMRRLGVKNTAEAVQVAVKSGCFKSAVEI